MHPRQLLHQCDLEVVLLLQNPVGILRKLPPQAPAHPVLVAVVVAVQKMVATAQAPLAA